MYTVYVCVFVCLCVCVCPHSRHCVVVLYSTCDGGQCCVQVLWYRMGVLRCDLESQPARV